MFTDAATRAISTTATSLISTTSVLRRAPVECCCRCCRKDAGRASSESCRTCADMKLDKAADCAAKVAPKPTQETTVPNFEAPRLLTGSLYSRPVYTEYFRQQETLTEFLAALPEKERAILGFTIDDLVIDCHYNGVRCNMSTWVLTVLDFGPSKDGAISFSQWENVFRNSSLHKSIILALRDSNKGLAQIVMSKS